MVKRILVLGLFIIPFLFFSFSKLSEPALFCKINNRFFKANPQPGKCIFYTKGAKDVYDGSCLHLQFSATLLNDERVLTFFIKDFENEVSLVNFKNLEVELNGKENKTDTEIIQAKNSNSLGFKTMVTKFNLEITDWKYVDSVTALADFKFSGQLHAQNNSKIKVFELAEGEIKQVQIKVINQKW